MEEKCGNKLEIEEMNVSVPWGTLAAVCYGDPRSEPVLVVHGIQDNAGSFERLLPLLPKGFYYVCLDLPGHGKSTRMPEGEALSFMQYVDAINRFVRQLSWTRFYYLGHSLGGQLGLYYAAMYPERIVKFIALDTVPFFMYKPEEFLKFHRDINNNVIKLEEKMKQSSPPSYTVEEAIERLMKNRSSPLKREAAEALVKRMLKNGKSGYYFSTDQRLKIGVRSFITLEQNLKCISNIDCPVLLILTSLTYNFCRSDDSSYKKIIELFESMPNVSIAVVEGYHDVHNNEPQIVAPHICNFLIQKKSLL